MCVCVCECVCVCVHVCMCLCVRKRHNTYLSPEEGAEFSNIFDDDKHSFSDVRNGIKERGVTIPTPHTGDRDGVRQSYKFPSRTKRYSSF